MRLPLTAAGQLWPLRHPSLSSPRIDHGSAVSYAERRETRRWPIDGRRRPPAAPAEQTAGLAVCPTEIAYPAGRDGARGADCRRAPPPTPPPRRLDFGADVRRLRQMSLTSWRPSPVQVAVFGRKHGRDRQYLARHVGSNAAFENSGLLAYYVLVVSCHKLTNSRDNILLLIFSLF